MEGGSGEGERKSWIQVRPVYIHLLHVQSDAIKAADSKMKPHLCTCHSEGDGDAYSREAAGADVSP